jgi:hypothetical protein
MFDSDQLLFILANPGAGAHRFGRIISCFDNVHWYSHRDNGITPWEAFKSDRIAGKSISKYHYDRLIDEETQVPIIGERIERWWFKDDVDEYYCNRWAPTIDDMDLSAIGNKYIHWILHDTPDPFLRRFPNARTIALIDSDMDAVVDRYLATTARFPVNLKFYGLRPGYLNDHARNIKELEATLEQDGRDPTVQDLWNWQNPGQEDNYRDFLLEKLTDENNQRKHYVADDYLIASWDDLNITQIQEFLGAETIDPNYRKLLK